MAMPPLPPSRALRVLVVDDEPEAAGALRLVLRGQGAEACLASDGLEALAAAEAFPPRRGAARCVPDRSARRGGRPGPAPATPPSDTHVVCVTPLRLTSS
jgi:CheY-like chemotaxis protein